MFKDNRTDGEVLRDNWNKIKGCNTKEQVTRLRFQNSYSNEVSGMKRDMIIVLIRDFDKGMFEVKKMIKCDKCNKEIDKEDVDIRLDVFPNTLRKTREIHLCSDCGNQVLKYASGEDNINNVQDTPPTEQMLLSFDSFHAVLLETQEKLFELEKKIDGNKERIKYLFEKRIEEKRRIHNTKKIGI